MANDRVEGRKSEGSAGEDADSPSQILWVARAPRRMTIGKGGFLGGLMSVPSQLHLLSRRPSPPVSSVLGGLPPVIGARTPALDGMAPVGGGLGVVARRHGASRRCQDASARRQRRPGFGVGRRGGL